MKKSRNKDQSGEKPGRNYRQSVVSSERYLLFSERRRMEGSGRMLQERLELVMGHIFLEEQHFSGFVLKEKK